MQDVQDAKIHTAKFESEVRLAAMRKELLAAEDRERAELEHEYRQAAQPWDTVRVIDWSTWSLMVLSDATTASRANTSHS